MAASTATVAVSANALSHGRATIVVPAGDAVTFAGTGWRCVNHHGYLTCQHGTDRPYVDLTSRHAGNFVVTVHPLVGPNGAPLKLRQQSDPVQTYTFSSTLK